MTGITKYERICQPLLAVVTCGLNLPPMILGLLASVHWCPYYGHFLAPNTFFCFIHISAAFFSIYKLRKEVELDRLCNDIDVGDDDDDVNGISAPIREETVATFTVIDPENNDYEKKGLEEAEMKIPAFANDNEDVNQRNNRDEEQETTTTTVAIHPSKNVGLSNLTPLKEPLDIPFAEQNKSTADIEEKRDDDAVHHPNVKPTHSCFRRCLKLRTTSSNRIRHLVCYNGFMTTYGILFLFWAFWLGSGEQIALASDNLSESTLEGCSDYALANQYHYVTVSLNLGYGKSKERNSHKLV
jgi:hypothetical protein